MSQSATPSDLPWSVSAAQVRRFWALVNAHGLPRGEAGKMLNRLFGKVDPAMLTMREYDIACKEILAGRALLARR